MAIMDKVMSIKNDNEVKYRLIKERKQAEIDAYKYNERLGHTDNLIKFFEDRFFGVHNSDEYIVEKLVAENLSEYIRITGGKNAYAFRDGMQTYKFHRWHDAIEERLDCSISFCLYNVEADSRSYDDTEPEFGVKIEL